MMRFCATVIESSLRLKFCISLLLIFRVFYKKKTGNNFNNKDIFIDSYRQEQT